MSFCTVLLLFKSYFLAWKKGLTPKIGEVTLPGRLLTPSLPRCHLETANESAKFESLLKAFLFLVCVKH